MATTSKEIVPYQEPKKSLVARAIAKVKSVLGRWIFPVALLIAVVVTWIVLFSVGMLSGSFGHSTYLRDMTIIVTVFHVVILVWPIVLIVQKKAWWRFIAVGLMLIGVWLTLPSYIEHVGPALWVLKILGPLALLLSAVAAYLLTRYAEEDQDLVNDAKQLPAHDEDIKKQERIVSKAASRAQHTKEVAKALGIESANLTQKAKLASEERSEKQKAYEKSPAAQEIVRIEKEIGTKTTEISDLTNEQLQLGRSMGRSNEKAGMSYADKQARRSEIKSQIEEIEESLLPLEEDLVIAKRNAERSTEKREYDAAAAISDAKNAAESDKRAELKKVKKEASAKTRAWMEEQAVLTGMIGKRNDITSRQQNAKETRRLLWRDDLFYPIICVVFATLFYASWYGWVALEVR